jgi:hypothetical protein
MTHVICEVQIDKTRCNTHDFFDRGRIDTQRRRRDAADRGMSTYRRTRLTPCRSPIVEAFVSERGYHLRAAGDAAVAL